MCGSGASAESVRTTRHFSYESVPEWNQTMVYPKVEADTLRLASLRVAVWNHDAYKGNEHLGQVAIDLAGTLARRATTDLCKIICASIEHALCWIRPDSMECEY